MTIAAVAVLCMVAHCLADFPLQGDFLANGKRDNLYLLSVHSTIWAGLVCFPVLIYTGTAHFVLSFAINAPIHAFIDRAKVNGRFGEGWPAFYRDQIFHAIQIAGIVCAAFGV